MAYNPAICGVLAIRTYSTNKDATKSPLNKYLRIGKRPKTPQFAGFYNFNSETHTIFKQ